MQFSSSEKNERLSNAFLKDNPAHVVLPAYERSDVTEGVVHIGVGGFHRSHQALYLDELLAYEDARTWAVCGVGIREADRAMADALCPQDGLYALIERDGAESVVRVVGSEKRFLWAHTHMADVLDALSSKNTHVITLTVTEGGYCCDDASGKLRLDHPDVVYDLQRPSVPRTLYGYLWYAFERRMQEAMLPVTVLSCDNVQQNGVLLRGAMLDFAAQACPALVSYIQSCVTFPSSMVDRITPMTTEKDRGDVRSALGVEDAWPVSSESFRQWVVEDRFAGKRPPLERVGVQWTEDVEPYERMKLRLLNAGHSAVGYLGCLMGYEYIHQAASDPLLVGLLQKMWFEEVIPFLPAVKGVDFSVYTQSLLKRFTNVAVADQVARICMDGSSKLPKFIFPSVLDSRRAEGGRYEALCFVTASWCRYLQGVDEQGGVILLSDPRAEMLKDWVGQVDVVRGVFAWELLRPVLGALCDDSVFLSSVENNWKKLCSLGSKQSLLALLKS